VAAYDISYTSIMESVAGMLKVLVFSGTGTPAANSPQCLAQAIEDSSSSLGSLLLSSCHQAFTNELLSLTTTELQYLGIDVSAFLSPASLLNLSCPRYHRNAVLSQTFLLLVQSLRYLACVESSNFQECHPQSLEMNAELGIGILGFSSGILSACAVASSKNTLTYINRVVEMYKVALWCGIRVEMHRIRAIADLSILQTSWSSVFVGIGKEATKSLLAPFNAVVRHSIPKSNNSC
jgi:hypothetical protein